MKYFLLPLGCATNKADAERIAAVLESIGYEKANSEEEANLVGIVACSIRQSAIDRVYGKVHKWNKRKNTEHLITFVSGCILPTDEKKFLKTFDIVLKIDQIYTLPSLLKEYGTALPQSFWEIAPKRTSTFTALVPIQNGCNKFCTYCAVPYTRGKEVSRPSSEILAEIKQLIDAGYKQMTLLGQNVNSYGLDKPKNEISFAELLRCIGEMGDASDRRLWVHYTSPHPQDMTEEVLDVQAQYNSLAKYLNLPLQSGNNDVLKKMNRRYTREKYMQLLDAAHAKMPGLTVSTDIIVGFCGETEEQFQDTVTAMQRGKYDLAFIAQYSPRPGAMAERRFEDSVPKSIKKEREKRLTEILKETALQNNKKIVGTTIPVLVETHSRKSGKMLGRTEGLKSIEFVGNSSTIGNFVQITITDCDAWRLYGTLA
ncbi:MAG TPA: tRNA (N6-isopentenyl adenosine(37)-C2)-methylthiotransferase MiaB [Patescibacteria group bacterium]|nr:tRNA (N6-isopentenyl adenosine(37)-C2)-methylthiotransferase MiaB [Patescibacteria group bacterium]